MKRVRKERGGKRKGMEGDKGEGKWGIGREENREERGEGKDEEYRIRIVENGEREEEKGKTRRKGGTGVERGKREEKEGWKRKEMDGVIATRKQWLIRTTRDRPQTDHRQTADTYLRSIPSCCQILSMIPMICSVSIS